MSERGEVRFGNTTIPYTITRSAKRRKTVAITLDPAAGVLVAAPLKTSRKRIEEIVTKRASWIVTRASNVDVLAGRRKEFVSGESLLYLGQSARLFVEHADVRRTKVTFEPWSFAITAPVHLVGEERRLAIEQALIRWYRDRASERLTDRTDWWAQIAGYAPKDVLIRDQRRRWGSCSPDGTLRYNWRLVMAPPALIDYLVVHELAHIQVRNHSPAFWTEVARLMPDYQLRRAHLKEIGPTLTI